MRGKTFVLSAVLLLWAGQALAAGFRLPEAGAKAQGMGFAFTAQADDPSAIYFNPAGLTQLDGNNVMAGVTYIKENGGEFTGSTPISPAVTTETQKDLEYFVPNAYITGKVSKDLALGVGIFSPFGLGQEYDNRNTSIFRTQITKIELRTLVVNPTVAYDFNEYLSVGAGVDFMYGSAKLDKNLGAISHLEGSGTAWGYNFGAMLKPAKSVKVGLNYRSQFDLKIDGDLTLVAPPPNSFPASTTIRMPATLALGIAYTPVEQLTLEVDADWTMWSRFTDLTIRRNADGAVLSRTQKNWGNTVALRAGAEYRATKALAVRVGYAYDPTPVPAETLGPDLPDSTRHNYFLGLGGKFGSISADLAYMYVVKTERTVNNQVPPGPSPTGIGMNGTWDENNAHLVALDLGYKF